MSWTLLLQDLCLVQAPVIDLQQNIAKTSLLISLALLFVNKMLTMSECPEPGDRWIVTWSPALSLLLTDNWL